MPGLKRSFASGDVSRMAKKRKRALSRSRSVIKRTSSTPSVARSISTFGPRNLNGFPNILRTKMRYVSEVTLDVGISGIVSHFFSANGLYDCDITGGGHQPMGFDQMMAQYRHYAVKACDIEAQYASNTGGGAVASAGFTILPTSLGSTGSIGTLAEALEQKRCGKLLVVGNRNMENRIVRHRIDLEDWYGTTVISEHDLRGSDGSNPSEQAYFACILGDIGGENPTAVKFIVTLEFDVTFFEPRIQEES